MPVDSALVVNVATPLAFSATVASVLGPSLNFTLPGGMPPDEVTVAVNVTDWPGRDGLTDDVNAVVESNFAMSIDVLGSLETPCPSVESAAPSPLSYSTAPRSPVILIRNLS